MKILLGCLGANFTEDENGFRPLVFDKSEVDLVQDRETLAKGIFARVKNGPEIWVQKGFEVGECKTASVVTDEGPQWSEIKKLANL